MAVLTVIHNASEQAIQAQVGNTILAALQASGITAPEAPCGGNGTCKKCLVLVNGQEVFACQTVVTGDCTVAIPEQNIGAVIASDGTAMNFPLTPQHGLGAAVDIGTTTVVAHLYDLETGTLLNTRSGVNCQRTFGADVISRIQYANENAGGLERMRDAIQGQLCSFLEELCTKSDRRLEELICVTIAANTVMEHIFTGLSPASIAVAPFTPRSLFGTWEEGSQLGLPKYTKVYLTPAVAGYVGGDITAGMLASSAYKEEHPVLFLDIGTNGEMALGSVKDGFICCAAAAGPAFEGAAISQGMSATRGAISAVEWADGKLKLSVLGNGKATGICGSGLVDALAIMLKLGAVDETGRLLPPEETSETALPYVDESDDGTIFRLTDEVCITEGDVRQLQLAKAAIAAGIATMLYEAGLREDDVAHLYLAGGFGNYIRKESAAAIGLLPASMLDRIISVGNTAGRGAAAVLLSQNARDILDTLSQQLRYIELSGHKKFNDYYIERIMFE